MDYSAATQVPFKDGDPVSIIKILRTQGVEAAITKLRETPNDRFVGFFVKYGVKAPIVLLCQLLRANLVDLLWHLDSNDLTFLADQAATYIDPNLANARRCARAACSLENASSSQAVSGTSTNPLLSRAMSLLVQGDIHSTVDLLNKNRCYDRARAVQNCGLSALLEAWCSQPEDFQRSIFSQWQQREIETLACALERYQLPALLEIKKGIADQQSMLEQLKKLCDWLSSPLKPNDEAEPMKWFIAQQASTRKFILNWLATELLHELRLRINRYDVGRELLFEIGHALVIRAMHHVTTEDKKIIKLEPRQIYLLKSKFLAAAAAQSDFKSAQTTDLTEITSTTLIKLLQLLDQQCLQSAQKFVNQLSPSDLLEVIFAADYLLIEPEKALKLAQRQLCQLMADNPLVYKPLIGTPPINRLCADVQLPLDSALAFNPLRCLQSFTSDSRLSVSYSSDCRHVAVSSYQTSKMFFGQNVRDLAPGHVKFSHTGAFIVRELHGDHYLLKRDTLLPITDNLKIPALKIIFNENDSACVFIKRGGGFCLVCFTPRLCISLGPEFHFVDFSPSASLAYIYTGTHYEAIGCCSGSRYWMCQMNNLRKVVLSPDGSLLALVRGQGTNGSTLLCDANTGSSIGQPEIPGNFLAFSPDGTRCIMANNEDETRSEVQFYTTTNARPLAPPITVNFTSYSPVPPYSRVCDFALNGHLVAIGRSKWPRAICHIATGKLLMHLEDGGTELLGESTNHDILVLQCAFKTLLVHADGRVVTLPGHFNFFSHDSKLAIVRSVVSWGHWQLEAYDTATGDHVWGPLLGRLTLDKLYGRGERILEYAGLSNVSRNEDHQAAFSRNEDRQTASCYRDFFMFTAQGGEHQLYRTSTGTPIGKLFGLGFVGLSQRGIVAHTRGRKSYLHDINEPPTIPDQVIEGRLFEFAPNGSGVVTIEQAKAEDDAIVARIFGLLEAVQNMNASEKLELLCRAQEAVRAEDSEDVPPPTKRRKTKPF